MKFITAILVSVVSLSAFAQEKQSKPFALYLVGSEGHITENKEWILKNSKGRMDIRPVYSEKIKNYLELRFNDDHLAPFREDTYVDLEFATDKLSNEQLKEGIYKNATRAGFHEGDENGLSITAEHSGCNTSIGVFKINKIELTDAGELLDYDAVWAFNCDSAKPAKNSEYEIYGRVVYGKSATKLSNSSDRRIKRKSKKVIRRTFDAPRSLFRKDYRDVYADREVNHDERGSIKDISNTPDSQRVTSSQASPL